jgi:hypothetical protein
MSTDITESSQRHIPFATAPEAAALHTRAVALREGKGVHAAADALIVFQELLKLTQDIFDNVIQKTNGVAGADARAKEAQAALDLTVVQRDLAVSHGMLGDWQNATFWSQQSHALKRRILATKPALVVAATVAVPEPQTEAKSGTAKPGIAKPGTAKPVTAKPGTAEHGITKPGTAHQAKGGTDPLIDEGSDPQPSGQESVDSAELANLPVPLHTDTAHQALPLALPIRTMPQPYTVVIEDVIEYLPTQSTPLMWYQGTLGGQSNGLWRTPSQSLQSWEWSEGMDYVAMPVGDALTGCLVVLFFVIFQTPHNL